MVLLELIINRDKRGNILEKIEIGTDEQLASGKLIARYKYDKFDNQIEFSVYDRNNKPALNFFRLS